MNDDAQALASRLAKVTITLSLNVMPKSTFWVSFRVSCDNCCFIWRGWGMLSGHAVLMDQSVFDSRNTLNGDAQVNSGSSKSPAMDALVDQLDQTPDVAERDVILREAAKLLMADIPMIPLYYEQDLYCVRDGVTPTPRADMVLSALYIDIASSRLSFPRVWHISGAGAQPKLEDGKSPWSGMLGYFLKRLIQVLMVVWRV